MSNEISNSFTSYYTSKIISSKTGVSEKFAIFESLGQIHNPILFIPNIPFSPMKTQHKHLAWADQESMWIQSYG